MAFQEAKYYESGENIYAGKLYYVTYTYTAGASGATYATVISWLVDKFNTLLDTLPDGYRLKLVSLPAGNYPVSDLTHVLLTTAGTSHNYAGYGSYNNVTKGSTANTLTQRTFQFSSNSADCHYFGITNNLTTSTTTYNVYDNNLAIQANASLNMNIWFKLYIASSIIPTE